MSKNEQTPPPSSHEAGAVDERAEARERPFLMPIGWKRAVVDELKKARSDFMTSDFEIAERIREVLESAYLATTDGSEG